MINQRMANADWENGYGDTALKGALGVSFVRRLAAAVIARAVQDISAGDNEARTALLFLFSAQNHCAGWLGLVDAQVDWMRPRVIRYYESVPKRYPGGDHAAKLRRKSARLALLRIRKYVHEGELPRAKKPTENDEVYE